MKHSEAPYSDKRKNFRFWLNRKPDLRWEFVEKTLHSGQIFYIKTNNSGSPGKIQVSVVKDYMGSSGGLTFASCPGLLDKFSAFPFLFLFIKTFLLPDLHNHYFLASSSSTLSFHGSLSSLSLSTFLPFLIHLLIFLFSSSYFPPPFYPLSVSFQFSLCLCFLPP